MAPRPISVRGGAGGIEAHYDDMVATARLFGRAAADTGGEALALHGYLVNPSVVASSAFDPVGAARFEATLLDALDGLHGVSELAVRCTVVDGGLRAAASAYLGADRLDEALTPMVDAITELPVAVPEAVSVGIGTGSASLALQRLVTDDPALADVGVDEAAGLLLHEDVASASATLALAFDDGTPKVTPLGRDSGADTAGPPRSLAGIMSDLDRRDRGRDGEIDVRTLDASSAGPRKVIVDITGTKDKTLARKNPDITSPVTNLRALSGESTSYERGVVQALRDAGVRADDDVLLVGHSEGGMIAVDAATHLAASEEFHVSHVITAGSPIGRTVGRVPSSVQVLALENDSDMVPHLDGAENPDRANVTTVTLDRGAHTFGESHGLTASYLPGAADVDASDDPSVRAYLDGLRGFTGARTVQTQVYQVSRAYK